jgi:hypothetical protein
VLPDSVFLHVILGLQQVLEQSQLSFGVPQASLLPALRALLAREAERRLARPQAAGGLAGLAPKHPP